MDPSTVNFKGFLDNLNLAESKQLELKQRLIEREALEEEIIALEIELHTQSLTLKEDNPQLVALWEKHRILRQSLQRLDHQIDDLEFFSEEDLNRLEKKLTDHVIEQYPDEKPLYLKAKERRVQLEQDRHLLHQIKEFFRALNDHLEAIKQTRQRVQRLNIFSYIFGQSPNLAIAQHLQAIYHLIEQILPSFDHLSSPLLEIKGMQKAKLETLKFLKDLQQESKQRWGFKKVDGVFQEAGQTAINWQLFWEEILSRQENDLKRQIEERRLWLKDFLSR